MCRGRPYQKQFFNGRTDVDTLRDDDDARAALPFKESGEMPRHRLPVMRNQNSSGSRGNREYIRVSNVNDAAFMCIAKVYLRFATANASYDFVIEISVRLKAGSHAEV
jgi:hypothetical protein